MQGSDSSPAALRKGQDEQNGDGRRGGFLITVALPTVAALALIVLTVSLGNWQLRRAAYKDEQTARHAEALALPAVAIDPRHPEAAQAAVAEGRRVLVRGRLLEDRTVFLDNATLRGRVGFQVITPLVLEGGGDSQAVLVIRGWSPANPARRDVAPAVPGAGNALLQVAGFARADLPARFELKASPSPAPQQQIWQSLSRERFERWSGVALLPLVVEQSGPATVSEGERLPSPSETPQSGASPAAPATVDRPADRSGRVFDDGLVREGAAPVADADKNRGYAFQWYSMAVLTAGLWLWFVLRPLLTVRRKSSG